MALIAGQSLLFRVWRIAMAVERVQSVLVATDDDRVADHARSFEASVVMTRPDCLNGTERAWDAVRAADDPPDAVINLQGDAVLTPPWIVQDLVDTFHREPDTQMVTAAVRLGWHALEAFRRHKETSPSSGTTVVTDPHGRALYFSKTIIPNIRKRPDGPLSPVNRHIGIYGYSKAALEQMVSLPPSPLEMIEQLEQLRALENRIPIQVVPVDYRGRSHGSVDTPEDIPVVEEIIAKEGELVP
jgi:3-deoxy-manno-octulosonate cytidylyltransferase (CMP-KDO synthetase)